MILAKFNALLSDPVVDGRQFRFAQLIVIATDYYSIVGQTLEQ